jgi:hypothetical protein
MSIKHHFTNEQTRQFCEEFGTDWHWSYSIDERDPSVQEMGKINRYFPQLGKKGMELSSSATARFVSYFKKKHPAGKTS